MIPPQPGPEKKAEEALPTLRILYDVAGWAFHHQARALQKYAPADFQVSLAPLRRPEDAATALGETAVDLVFLLPDSKTQAVREVLRQRGWPSKLVVGWSTGVPRRLATFYELYPKADAWVINNQAYWDTIGRLPRTFMIPNGVDLDVFNVTQPLEARTPKVLWMGSELYRRLKGYDDFMLPLQRKLRVLGIDCELLLVDSFGPDKRTPAQMAEWYNRGTVLVCASESEGTPNPALEAAACGCTVVSTRVGNMPELIRHDVNGYLVDREVGALLRGIQAACQNYPRVSRAMQSDIQAWHWAARSAEFFRLFRDVLEDCHQRRTRRRNLSKEVTVFVTTVGAATFTTCLERLRQQDCTYRLEIIDHVAPMNTAFQRMLDECRTPYYVQVDEDMLLYPHAVRTLYETIAGAAPEVAMFAADLYDVHLRLCIAGVKIFRHDIVRRYSFKGIDSFEVEQLARLAEDGYTYLQTTPGATPVTGQTLGLHGVQWTPQSIYERYATLARRSRLYPSGFGWLRAYPGLFLQRFLGDPSPENFFALQGIIAGTLTSRHGEAGAKDFRTYAAHPGFQPLRRFLEELGQPAPDAMPESRTGMADPSPNDDLRTPKRRRQGVQTARAAKRDGGERGHRRSPGE